jgi:hypothetical protein
LHAERTINEVYAEVQEALKRLEERSLLEEGV